ncbi:hypothetical protein [Streptomyces sp. NPDC048248]|uniref:hypothetical protein n=1 Tax=Streptomyces sp. NPDC048248 TaxID=3365523 RepID=UPI00371EB208
MTAAVSAVRAGQGIPAVTEEHLEFLDASADQEAVAVAEDLFGHVIDASPRGAVDQGGANVVGGPEWAQSVGTSNVAALGHGVGGCIGKLDLAAELEAVVAVDEDVCLASAVSCPGFQLGAVAGFLSSPRDALFERLVPRALRGGGVSGIA